MPLPHDITRCNGIDCERKETCLRYTERKNVGKFTMIIDSLCDFLNEFHYYLKGE